MKKLIIAFLVATTSVMSAQNKEYKHPLNGITKVKIESRANVRIIAANVSELAITYSKKEKPQKKSYWYNPESSKKEKKQREDKRKGLTAIYPGGKDNSNGFGFAIKKEGSTLIVKDLKSTIQGQKVDIKLPKNIDVVVDADELGDVYVEGFSSEIEVETTAGKIDVKKVTGPVTLHSSIGNINVDFSNVNQSSPITISSSASEIDVTLPSNTKASLDMKTNGTVYTNFDLKAPEKDGLKNISSKKIVGNINNGGVKIKLNSSLGDIYLRKK